MALTGPGLDPNLLLPPLASSKIYKEDADSDTVILIRNIYTYLVFLPNPNTEPLGIS